MKCPNWIVNVLDDYTILGGVGPENIYNLELSLLRIDSMSYQQWFKRL